MGVTIIIGISTYNQTNHTSDHTKMLWFIYSLPQNSVFGCIICLWQGMLWKSRPCTYLWACSHFSWVCHLKHIKTRQGSHNLYHSCVSRNDIWPNQCSSLGANTWLAFLYWHMWQMHIHYLAICMNDVCLMDPFCICTWTFQRHSFFLSLSLSLHCCILQGCSKANHNHFWGVCLLVNHISSNFSKNTQDWSSLQSDILSSVKISKSRTLDHIANQISE